MYKQILFSLCAVAFLACNRTKTVSTEKAETGVCPQITNIQARCSTSLDGEWNYIVDIYGAGYLDYRRNPVSVKNSFFRDRGFYGHQKELIEYDFDAAPTLHVPGDWNTQKPELYYYEGTVWYRTLFHQKKKPGCRYFP